MKQYGYQLLLFLSRSLVYLKRGFQWLGGSFAGWGKSLLTVYQNTVGFRIYKVAFWLRKYMGGWRVSSSWRLFDLLGQRGILEIILCAVALIVMLPHSRVLRAPQTPLPGSETLLYQLVGPGEIENSIEEVNADFTHGTEFALSPDSWRLGAVILDNTSSPSQSNPFPQPEIAGAVPGGGALAKPTIISALPSSQGAAMAQVGIRHEVVNYTVQPGDIIGAIAARYGIGVNTILWANNLTVRSYIRPGDVLKILPADGVLHTVKKGETVSKIARTYNATEKNIIVANKLQEDGRDIVIGEVLIVPGGERPVPPAAPRYQPLRSIAAPPPSITAPAGSGFIWPAGVRRITQYFGFKHTGADIAGPLGTPLYASAAGIVIKSQCGYNGGYGCHVVVDHGGGIHTLYGHVNEMLVSVGDEVVQGQVIALMGSTGRSTGSHVHFEVRLNGKFQNPLQYVRQP